MNSTTENPAAHEPVSAAASVAAATPAEPTSVAAPAAPASEPGASEPGASEAGASEAGASEAGASEPARRRPRRRKPKGRAKAPEAAAAAAGPGAGAPDPAAAAAVAKADSRLQQPRRRQVHPVLERLAELYPKMFGARFHPLKLGVYQELLALHPDEFKKEDVKVALGLHARSTRYLEAVAAGEGRHDLNGVQVEPIAPEHVHHAIVEVFKRRQARGAAADLRPALVARLVQAVEASGLSREDYMAIARSNDPAATEALDEAFVQIGARVAKREALRRAFEASGRSITEFAEMYGMDPDEVGRMLK